MAVVAGSSDGDEHSDFPIHNDLTLAELGIILRAGHTSGSCHEDQRYG